MKKSLPALSLAVFASVSLPGPAGAADNTVVGVGSGAVAGAVVAGPVGAVVGAVAGGFIGANTPSARTGYRRRARAAYRRRTAEYSAPTSSSVRSVSLPAAQPVEAVPSPSASTGRTDHTWSDPE